MNLTMNSTIIELSVHACNFVLKELHREEPGARVWPKLMLKLQPKIAIFKLSVYSPAFLHNFHTYSTVYFSHPIIKISWEKFGLLWFIEFLEQTLHAPLRQCKMKFWNEHNSGQKQTKLFTKSRYSVFSKWKWIVKAKSVSLFGNTPTLTLKLT